MSNYPHLSKAPIEEAIIDIQVTLPINFEVIKLSSLGGEISEKYPQEQALREIKGGLKFEGGKASAPEVTDTLLGFRYDSQDKKQIVQFRKNGFTFSRIKPYETWEDLKAEGLLLWGKYKNLTNPNILRVALRYINKINISNSNSDLSYYVNNPPKVPQDLPQDISGYLSRVTITKPSIGATAIITQAVDPSSTEIGPLILDIDVYKVSSNIFKEADAISLLDELRNFKNDIFFGIITDNMVEVYK